MVTDILPNCTFVLEHYHATDAGVKILLYALVKGIKSCSSNPFIVFFYSSIKYQNRQKNDKIVIEKFSDPDMIHLSADDIDLSEAIKSLMIGNSNKIAGITLDIPELGYNSKTYKNVYEFLRQANKRKKAKLLHLRNLLGLSEYLVHHIHNPTLMKNPVETYANYLVARELLNEPYVQIRHIHDLTEDNESRKKLRDLQKEVAGQMTEIYFGKNGAGISWQSSPNISYITINSKDMLSIKHAFEGHINPSSIFCCPNPVDTESLMAEPVWEIDGQTLDDALKKYASQHADSGNRFDTDSYLLLATEVARKRKNTGEQLLLLRLLNNMSKKTGQKFQLAITTLPTGCDDRDRIKIFQKYIRLNHEPVIMGFAKDLFANGTKRSSGKFHMRDLWNHPRAVATISTSTNESFGFNFIHPAIATLNKKSVRVLPTVGRIVKKVFDDLAIELGVVFPADAFYERILIDKTIIDNKYIFLVATDGIVDANALLKLLKLQNYYTEISVDNTAKRGIPLGYDFSEYSAFEQVLLMEIIDYNKLSKRLARFLFYIENFDKEDSELIKNTEILISKLSLAEYMKRIGDIVKNSFEHLRRRILNGEKTYIIQDNSKLRAIYSEFEKKTISKTGRVIPANKLV